MKPKVIVVVRGGVVVDITSDVEMDAIVVNYDTDGSDPEVLIDVPYKYENNHTELEPADCYDFEVGASAKQVRNLYNYIKKEMEK